MRIGYGIVEVGMGGKTDATNVMKNKAITVISKIGMDHAEYLGSTIREIAAMKAGIMVEGVPCVVDDTNEPKVMDVLSRHASRTGAPLIMSSTSSSLLDSLDKSRWTLENWQMQNLLCATTAFRTLFPETSFDLNRLMESRPALPGRMQTVHISPTNGSDQSRTALVDGAHNPLAIEQLAQHVDKNVRAGEKPVTWLIGFSNSSSKPFQEMLKMILRPQDNVAFVEYRQRENEPPPVEAQTGRQWVVDCLGEGSLDRTAPANLGLEEALEWARQISAGGPLVITGSLYLMRDVLGLSQVAGDLEQSKPQRVGADAYRKLAKKKSRGEITGEELALYQEVKRTYYDPMARARLKRRNQKRAEAGAVKESSAGNEATKTPQIISEAPEPGDIAVSEGQPTRGKTAQSATSRRQVANRSLATPFAYDPDSPGGNLRNLGGALSNRAKKRAAWAARVEAFKEAERQLDEENADVADAEVDAPPTSKASPVNPETSGTMRSRH
jgi:folylpolyglutamate synthase